jgi:hypothetical protein
VVEFTMTGDVLTLISADPAGQEIAMKMAVRTDGQDHPVQFGDDTVLQARWTSDRTLETVLKQSERTVAEGTYEVSRDGRSLVVSTTDSVVVFERA